MTDKGSVDVIGVIARKLDADLTDFHGVSAIPG
jgi:hypothetical protein